MSAQGLRITAAQKRYTQKKTFISVRTKTMKIPKPHMHLLDLCALQLLLMLMEPSTPETLEKLLFTSHFGL